jgi:hypothetical protein
MSTPSPTVHFTDFSDIKFARLDRDGRTTFHGCTAGSVLLGFTLQLKEAALALRLLLCPAPSVLSVFPLSCCIFAIHTPLEVFLCGNSTLHFCISQFVSNG